MSTIPNQTPKNGVKAKRSNCPTWIFSQKTTNKIFMYLLAPFILQFFKKILTADPEWSICPEQFFFGTNHYYCFHLPISPFHCAKLKKILPADPKLWGCSIFGPKMTHLPKWVFFRKSVNESCFFHSCLSTFPKLKSDVTLLVKYWKL